VLGVPVFVVPYAGMPLLFLKTPFGMVAVTALISLYFFSDFDAKFADEDEKRRLVAVFARHTLNGEMTVQEFERLKLAVEYFDDIQTDALTDPLAISLVDWLKGGSLPAKWREEKSACPTCGSKAFEVINGDRSFLVCCKCNRTRPSHTLNS